MRPTVIVLIILFIIFQYALWLSPGGLVQIWHIKDSIAAITQQNTALAQRNMQLEADVEDLKSGNEAIEERARNDLGMIKQGETFYQVAK